MADERTSEIFALVINAVAALTFDAIADQTAVEGMGTAKTVVIGVNQGAPAVDLEATAAMLVVQFSTGNTYVARANTETVGGDVLSDIITVTGDNDTDEITISFNTADVDITASETVHARISLQQPTASEV